ncbi:MAG: hypothetical protein HQM10_07455 [Candidatus Riflebacteria bacterium]|nr:hypothetical protein [Candidatus Riflebacteria bacterium]
MKKHIFQMIIIVFFSFAMVVFAESPFVEETMSPSIINPSSSGSFASACVSVKETSFHSVLCDSEEQLRAKIENEFDLRLLDGIDGTKWTKEALEYTYQVLSSLPKYFTIWPELLIREGRSTQGPLVGGRAEFKTLTWSDGRIENKDVFIYLYNISLRDPITFKQTLVHEFAHCYFMAHQKLETEWQNLFWKKGMPEPPSVSDYGNSNLYEDMAESVARFVSEPEILRVLNPLRYQFIKEKVFNR